MRSNYCLTIFHVSILAVLILTLDADSEDSKCETEITVRRNMIYEAFVGQDLRINCTVAFCNSSPPTVVWYKLEETTAPVDVSSDSHIKTDWTTLTHLEGTSSLIFKNILSSDSGHYWCQSDGSVSHTINVSVYDNVEPTTVTWTTLKPENPTQDFFWYFVYGFVGFAVFAIVVIVICVAPKRVCKGVHCARGSRTTTDPSLQSSYHESPNIHIYENEP